MSDTLNGEKETVTLADILPKDIDTDNFDMSSYGELPFITLFNIGDDDPTYTPSPEKAILIPERTHDVDFNLKVLIPAALAKVVYLSKTSPRKYGDTSSAVLLPLLKVYYLGLNPAPQAVEYIGSKESDEHIDIASACYYEELLN